MNKAALEIKRANPTLTDADAIWQEKHNRAGQTC
jgi:hypothetical protein